MSLAGKLFLLLAFVVPAAGAATPSATSQAVREHPLTALFYMTDSPASIRDFYAHSSQIGLLVPTWYRVDENGLVTGEPEPGVLARAKSEKLPVMPLVSISNKRKFHLLAEDPAAQAIMNAALIRECRLHGYAGFQFDFEDISWTDRDALSALVARSAEALHHAGFQLSIATVPNAPGYPAGNGFSKWIYTDWRGAYDLAALAKSVDLICLMTYDQHTRWTTPGPVAGWNWTLDNLKYALREVPRSKLSLGIPLYGYHWYTGAPVVDAGAASGYDPNPTAASISAPDALQLAHDWNGTIQWDPVDRTAWFWFYRDQMREWVFFTDARTFRARYDLARSYGLEGFCAWVLGQEDPAIWKLLPARR
jgi:spore germination protein YaaH